MAPASGWIKKRPHGAIRPSPVDRSHTGCGIPIAYNLILRNGSFELGYFGRRQLDLRRGRILLQVVSALRSRNWRQILALLQYPRERELTSLNASALRNRSHPRHQHLVLVEVLAREPRVPGRPEIRLA